MTSSHPKLRELETFTHRENGREYICLRDPLGIEERVMAVSTSVLPALQLLDGHHSISEIRKELTALFGQPVSRSVVERLIQQLDDAHMLYSPKFDAHRDAVLRAYRALPVRAPSHAGKSYPAEPAAIHRAFARHFNRPCGPGRTPAAVKTRTPLALMAPHFDLRQGGVAYAHAYAPLRDAESQPSTYIILGVAHKPVANRFVATRKDFETPLGVARVNHEIMNELDRWTPFDLQADELAHKMEHSIEFQVVYLQHVLGARPFQIVPILTGSFDDLTAQLADPMEDENIRRFVEALRKVVAGAGQDVCVIASVDLAHVGRRFGDDFTINPGVMEQVADDDRALLKQIEARRSDGLREHIYSDQNRRRVDGFGAMYTLLSALKPSEARLLYYDRYADKGANSLVTYASMVFY